MSNAEVLRGEIWEADLDPIPGRPELTVKLEQAGKRPVLIISRDEVNRSRAGLVIVLPITTTLRVNPAHIAVKPPEGGLNQVSFVLCDQVTAISQERLMERRGRMTSQTMKKVMDAFLLLIGY